MSFARLIAGGVLVVCLMSLGIVAAAFADPQAPVVTSQAAASDRSATTDEARRVQDAIDVLTALTTTPDNAIPHHLLERAEAIVVIPSLVKGGFIVGARHGKGVMSVRDRTPGAWSPPAFVKLTGGSIGWQIGVESVDLVLLVMNKDGVEQLLQDRFTIGGSAGVTAGPVGRSAEAATNAQLNAGVLAYSRAKGLFAGATIEGAALQADADANKTFYSRSAGLHEIVMGRLDKTTLPAVAGTWMASVARIASSDR